MTGGLTRIGKVVALAITALVVVAAVAGVALSAASAVLATVVSVGNPPSVEIQGHSFSEGYTVRNPHTKSSASATLQFYLGRRRTHSAADARIGEVSIPSLGPNVKKSGQAKVTIPRTTTPGSYFVLGCIGTSCAASTKEVQVKKPAPAIHLSRSTVPFGGVAVGQTSSQAQSVTVTNTGTAALTISSVTLAGTDPGDFTKFLDTCSGVAVKPGSNCTLAFTFKPTAVGGRSALAKIMSNAPISPSITLTGTGDGAVISVDSNPIDFGKVTENDTKTLTETVHNTGNVSLHVSTLGFSGAQASVYSLAAGQDQCSGATVAPGSTCQVGVSFTPAADGQYPTQTLAINSDAVGQATLDVGLNGTGAFTLFGLDPTVITTNANFKITVSAVGLTSSPQTVELTRNGTTVDLASSSGGDPNEFTGIVPAGLTPGVYDVSLADGSTDTETLAGALTLASPAGVSVGSVSPPFASDAQATDATVRITSNNLVSGARAYLTPNQVQPNGWAPNPVAVEVNDTFVSASAMKIHIPSGTANGLYDLIMINPDGTAGVSSNAVTVTGDALPSISGATPATLVDQAGQLVTLTGSNFLSGATVSASVEGGGTTPFVNTGTVSCSGSSCSVPVAIDASNLTPGSVLVLRLTNPDGVFSDYGPVAVTNSSLNLPNPAAGPPLMAARRAPGLVVAQNASGERFLYAIGGDAGAASASSPLSSVEVSSIDKFGQLGTWANSTALPAGRSMLGAVAIGQYVYVLGGQDGTNPLNSVERAQVLDPAAAPQITDTQLELAGAGSNVASGTWSYEISATFSGLDASNPGGESLPSFPVTVRVPASPNLKVSLAWSSVPGATGYNVYRLPAAAGSGTPVLLTHTATTSYTDDGTGTPGAQTPQTDGSLGNWAAMPAMNAQRQAPGVAVGYDPSNANQAYIYAGGGLSAGPVAQSTYEYLPVTVNPDGTQTVAGAWTAGSHTLPTGAWQLAALSVGSAQSSSIPAGTNYVYFIGGVAANGSAVTNVVAGQVALGGDLGTFASEAPLTGSIAGAGSAALPGGLYLLGGLNAAPSTSIRVATISASPPALRPGAWNSAGPVLLDPLYLPGSATNRAAVYLAGGQTASSAATSDVEIFP